MIIVPPAFYRAARKADPEPFLYAEIESKGVSDEATTESDWTNNWSSANVDYNVGADGPPPGIDDVILAAAVGTTVSSKVYATSDITNEWDTGGFADIDDDPTPDDDTTYLRENRNSPEVYIGGLDNLAGLVPDNATIVNATVEARVRDETGASTRDFTLSIRVNGTTYYGSAKTTAIDNSYGDFTEVWNTNPDTAATWLYQEVQNIEGIGIRCEAEVAVDIRCTRLFLTIEYNDFETTGNIVIPLEPTGANTENKATISVSDLTPSGSGLSYTAKGSTTGAWAGEEVALGAVADGTQVDGYEYYRVTASFTGDGSVTPVLSAIGVSMPDTVYKFSTSLAPASLGARPLIEAIPGRSTEISLKDFATTTSGISMDIVRTPFVDRMIQDNYLKGLSAYFYVGLVSPETTSISDLLPYDRGAILKYKAGETSVKISMSDSTKDMSVKIPEAASFPSTTPLALTYDGTLMADVILDLLDRAGIRARFIDAGSFTNVRATLGDGSVAPSSYVVYRGPDPPENNSWDTSIFKPMSVKKLSGEVLEVMGCYLFPQENGKLTLIEYDATDAAIDEWGDDQIEGGSYDPGYDKVFNQIYFHFDHMGGNKDTENFDSIYVDRNAASVTRFGKVDTKIIKSEWVAGDSTDGYFGDEISVAVVDREIARLKDGLGSFSCSTDISLVGLQLGDMITIDHPAIIAPHIDPNTTSAKFMIIKKTFKPNFSGMSWEFTEAKT